MCVNAVTACHFLGGYAAVIDVRNIERGLNTTIGGNWQSIVAIRIETAMCSLIK